MVAIADSTSVLPISDNAEHREAKDDEEQQQGKLNEDVEPSWLINRMTNTVPQHIQWFRQKPMMVS
jgi:hypothetical protein